MQKYLSCICCGETKREIISRTGRNFTKLTTVICTGCGLIHSDPIPTKEELKNFYERDYRLHYKSVPEPLLKHTLRYAKDSLDFLIEILGFCNFENMNQKNFLDIGAGSGEILYFAKKLGFNTKGIEPNKGYASFCKNKLQLDVINSDKPSAVFKIMLPVNPSESKISHSPEVILFGSTKPTKLFFKKLFDIKS